MDTNVTNVHRENDRRFSAIIDEYALEELYNLNIAEPAVMNFVGY
jgi:hypothetical protein